MDFDPAERAIKKLEMEANRVAGLGDLRDQLMTLSTQLGESLVQLDSLSGVLSESKNDTANALDALKVSLETQEDIQKKSFKALNTALEGGLDSLQAALGAGLDSVHGLIRGICREIDETVKARLERYLAEYQILLRSESRALHDHIDLGNKKLEGQIKDSEQRVLRKITYGLFGISVALVASTGIIVYFLVKH